MICERFLYKAVVIVLGIITPCFFAQAAISITEVVWMGSSQSQYEEWVELFNDGADEVVLDGWKLKKSGGVVLFSPKGTILGGTYYLICRTTNSLTNPLGGICNEQGTFGGSGLNNSSDQLSLENESGELVEAIDATAGWPAGEVATKQTMQKKGSTWVTQPPTPHAETVLSGGESEEDTPPDDSLVIEKDKQKDKKEIVALIDPDPAYSARMIIGDYTIAGIEMNISAETKQNNKITTLQGRYEWSLGDGSSFKFNKNIPLKHIFKYPGTYTVVLAYYSNFFKEDPDSLHRKKVIVLPANVILSGVTDDGGVIIENNTTKEINLSGWKIKKQDYIFTLPNHTFISSQEELQLSPQIVGFFSTRYDQIVLLNPTGVAIDYLPKPVQSVTVEQDYSELIPEEEIISIEEPVLPNLPKEKTFKELVTEYTWYILFAVFVTSVLVAYLVFKLYATSNDIPKSQNELEDTLDFL